MKLYLKFKKKILPANVKYFIFRQKYYIQTSELLKVGYFTGSKYKTFSKSGWSYEQKRLKRSKSYLNYNLNPVYLKLGLKPMAMFDGLGVPTVMGNKIFNSCNVWQIFKIFYNSWAFTKVV